jgi:hypothetical protein
VHLKERMFRLLRELLDRPLINRIRRNHGLEHATIHMLSSRYPRRSIAGRADAQGFFILGNLSTEAIAQASQEALQRVQGGEQHLAIHPNCGTNFLTAGLLAALGSYFALLGGNTQRWRDRLERLPLAVMTAVAALLVAQPLGTAAQRHLTTRGDMDGMQILAVKRLHRGRTAIHRIFTRD